MTGEATGRPVGAVTRVLGALTISTVKAREAKIEKTAETKLAEELFEFQIDVSGVAGGAVTWLPFTCMFPAPMISAPGQRDSPFDVPQFWSGYALTKPSAPVVIAVYVDEWVTDDRGYTVGATVQIGAFRPGASDTVNYSGTVHAAFQGYSGPVLEEDDSQGA